MSCRRRLCPASYTASSYVYKRIYSIDSRYPFLSTCRVSSCLCIPKSFRIFYPSSPAMQLQWICFRNAPPTTHHHHSLLDFHHLVSSHSSSVRDYQLDMSLYVGHTSSYECNEQSFHHSKPVSTSSRLPHISIFTTDTLDH